MAKGIGCQPVTISLSPHPTPALSNAAIQSLAEYDTDKPVLPIRLFRLFRSNTNSTQPASPAEDVRPAAPSFESSPRSPGRWIEKKYPRIALSATRKTA